MKQFSVVVVLFSLLAVLYVTNPTKPEFYTYIEDSTERKMAESEGTGVAAIDDKINSLAGKYSKQRVKDDTTREDFLFLSLYTIDASDQQHIYLGMVDRFFYLYQQNET